MSAWRCRILTLFLCSVVVWILPSGSAGSVIHVPGDVQTIQDGIDAASTDDTVLVAAGTYTGAGNTNLTFDGTNLVLLSEDGASLTTIDGQGQNRGIVFSNGEDSTSVVDGFTFKRGNEALAGSLILVSSGSSPIIRNCIIRQCRGSAGVIRVGGGSPAFRFCTVEHDTSTASSAVVVFDGGSPRIHGCVIQQNLASSAVRSRVPTLISLTKITDNTGIGAHFDSTLCVVTDCDISRNGGRGVILNASSGTFDGDVFQENGDGGVLVTGLGASVLAARPGEGYAPATTTGFAHEFTDCEFSGHSTDRGAGFFFDCTNEPEDAYTLMFTGCRFTGNYATFEGGGVAVCGHATNADIVPVFTNCTIAANSANDGGGVYMGVTDVGTGRLARAEFIETILWGNCSTDSPDGEAYVLGGNEVTIECSHSNVDQIAGAGSIYTSQVTTGIPYFCDYPGEYYATTCTPMVTIEGNFSLAPDSPAAPSNHPCGPDQIGAFPVESCVATGTVGPTPGIGTAVRPPAPNPFNPTTAVEFTLAADSRVLIRIYDVGGRRVRILVDRPLTQGVHRVEWDGRDSRGNLAASGVYLLRFEAGRTRQTQKMVLLK